MTGSLSKCHSVLTPFIGSYEESRMSSTKHTVIRKSEHYVVDGKEYHNLADIPASERKRIEEHLRVFEDKDKDGTPDIFQHGNAGSSIVSSKVSHTYSGAGSELSPDLLKDVLGSLSKGSSNVTMPSIEGRHQKNESPRDARRRKDRSRERVKTVISTTILLAVVIFLTVQFS